MKKKLKQGKTLGYLTGAPGSTIDLMGLRRVGTRLSTDPNHVASLVVALTMPDGGTQAEHVTLPWVLDEHGQAAISDMIMSAALALMDAVESATELMGLSRATELRHRTCVTLIVHDLSVPGLPEGDDWMFYLYFSDAAEFPTVVRPMASAEIAALVQEWWNDDVAVEIPLIGFKLDPRTRPRGLGGRDQKTHEA
jgi:hypothetical protein